MITLYKTTIMDIKNSELKPLEFGDRILYYYGSKYGDSHREWEQTSFYETNDRYKVVPKYQLLNFLGIDKSTKVVTNNKLLFELTIDINSIYYTKSEVRRRIQKKVDLLNRVEEIKKGKII